MNLHEYQGKLLFAEYDLPVSKGEIIFNAEDAIDACNKIGGSKWVVKAQVHAGGRGKAGGVKLIDDPKEAIEFAKKWLGNKLITYQTDKNGQTVNSILIEECTDIASELYLSAVIDRESQSVVFIGSSEGGVNIEDVAKNSPEKIIYQGCHGVAIFGSTGQAQLIPISEKINLLNSLSLSRYKKNFLVGTGLNSLSETINLMRIALSLGFKQFLIMPPAYYKYEDEEVIQFYTKIVEAVPGSEIILYNFEKLCGYNFSIECVKELVKKFPNQIVGVKDSSYNLFENLKLKNFSIII